jgi:hypothetical protein
VSWEGTIQALRVANLESPLLLILLMVALDMSIVSGRTLSFYSERIATIG